MCVREAAKWVKVQLGGVNESCGAGGGGYAGLILLISIMDINEDTSIIGDY